MSSAQDQEVFQIHLIPKSLSEKLALRAATLAQYAASGKDPATVPPVMLNFEHFSGRGVRYRVLAPEEKDLALSVAAGLVGPNATYPELNAKHAVECVKKMLVAVTRKGELASLDGLGAGDWVLLNDAMLAGMPGQEPWKFEKLFSAKDVGVLRTIYRRLHEVTEADVDEIEGKAISVVSE